MMPVIPCRTCLEVEGGHYGTQCHVQKRSEQLLGVMWKRLSCHQNIQSGLQTNTSSGDSVCETLSGITGVLSDHFDVAAYKKLATWEPKPLPALKA